MKNTKQKNSKDFYTKFNETYPFLRIEKTIKNDIDTTEILFRLTSRCNQRCPFCSADLASQEPPFEILEKCFKEVNNKFPNSTVTLTGGEPTLRKDIIDITNCLLKSKKIADIQIQTNAVIIGLKPERFNFPKSPKLRFFVSLHALKTPVYNLCTNSKGQLPFAIKGIRILQKADYRITINSVVNKANVDYLKEFILMLSKVLYKENFPDIHFSIMMCPEYRDKAPDFLVEYKLLSKKLLSAIETAQKNGIRVDSLLSSTHASIPSCMLSAKARIRQNYPEIYEHETGYEDFSKLWLKAKSCKKCRETKYCLGLPRPYAQKFGFDELKPIK